MAASASTDTQLGSLKASPAEASTDDAHPQGPSVDPAVSSILSPQDHAAAGPAVPQDHAAAGYSTDSQSWLPSWLVGSAIPCAGSRPEKLGALEYAPVMPAREIRALGDADLDAPPSKAKPTSITVHTSTPGGVQEKRCFSRDATVYDLRCTFREVKGKQYKLLSADGRELDNGDSLSDFLEDEYSPELLLTKVNVCHPITLDMLVEIDSPKKDATKCEVFPLGFLEVTMGTTTYSKTLFTEMSIENPQPAFRAPGKLEPYRAGYDYYDTHESYEIGEGRHRMRMLPARKEEMEKELRARLPQFRHLAPQIFTNPDRIHKLRAFMDKDEFPPTRENLHRFLNVVFDLLTDKTALLL